MIVTERIMALFASYPQEQAMSKIREKCSSILNHNFFGQMCQMPKTNSKVLFELNFFLMAPSIIVLSAKYKIPR